MYGSVQIISWYGAHCSQSHRRQEAISFLFAAVVIHCSLWHGLCRILDAFFFLSNHFRWCEWDSATNGRLLPTQLTIWRLWREWEETPFRRSWGNRPLLTCDRIHNGLTRWKTAVKIRAACHRNHHSSRKLWRENAVCPWKLGSIPFSVLFPSAQY